MFSTVFFSTLNHLLIHHSALLVVLVKLEFGFFGVLQQSKAENMKLSFDVVQIKQTLQTLTNSSAGIKQGKETAGRKQLKTQSKLAVLTTRF